MKSKIGLSDFLKHLPEPLQEGVAGALKNTECQPELHRHVETNSLTPTKGEKTFVGYASTRTIDRDQEIVMPNGMDILQFQKAPVLLWGHRWGEPPIGKDEVVENDHFGLKTRSKLADTALANELWMLVKDDMLKTSSIGFVPVEFMRPGDKGWGGLMDELSRWPEFDKKAELRAVVTKAILLEHSLVSVPANIDALVTSIAQKGLSLPLLSKELKMEVPPPPPAPAAVPKAVFHHCLIKTPEQLHLELELEIAAMVARELKFQRGQL
jgi:HK97 family phage prohead protease